MASRRAPTKRPCGFRRAAFSCDQPDHNRKGRGRRQHRPAEKQQRRIENRPRLHVHLQVERLAVEPGGQRLIPLQDVAALHARGVVKEDLARDVHPERHHLGAVPAGVAHAATGGFADQLLEVHGVAPRVEPVAGPRKRRQPRQLPHIVHGNGHVGEAPGVAAREADARHADAWTLEEAADVAAIDTRPRIGRQTGTTQRHDRRDRGIDVQRRGAVEREIDLLLVLRKRSEGRAHAARRHGERAEEDERE